MKPLFPLAAALALLPLTLSAQETPPEEKPEKPAEPKLKSTIRISKETTYLTEPVTAEGYVDYLKALNQRMSEGVTPENNAAVPLIKAFGPRATPPVAGDRAYRMLGIEPLPAEGTYYQPLKEVIFPGKDRYPTPEESQRLNKLYDDMSEAGKRPWSAQTYPELAQWLKVNEEPLKLVAEAATRPKLYFPLITSAEETDKPGQVIAVLLPWTQETRELARILSCRAMWHLEQGDTQAARQDMLTIHRLSRLNATGFSLIEKLVGYALEAMARVGDLAVLEHGKLSEQELLDYRKQLQQLPPFDPVANSVDKGERLLGLDAISMLDRQGLSEINSLIGGGAAEEPAIAGVIDFIARHGGVDWNEVMIRMNKGYDELVAAFNQPTYDQRIAAFEEQEQRLKKLKLETSDPLKLAAQLLVSGNPRMFISRQVGNVLIALLTPAVAAVHEAETRIKTNMELFDLALLLTVHKQRTGVYPESLDALVPGLIASVPVDVYSGKPYVYRKTDAGFSIYSFGRNRQDDNGRSSDDEPRGDDLIIHMPAVHKPRPE